ncbi:MAG: GNAT family N-acetyltransferase [Phycisphaeraceae bacterium]|nr:GNAT family N-acetyltransferase [Phycisphaeraceae bacterium]
MLELTYAVEPDLSVEEFIDILKRSTLAERRPIDQPDRMQGMVKQADIMATARDASGLLVGVSRALTDFSHCTYLADLAVDQAFQKQGIGKALIEYTHQQAGKHTLLLLIAAPKARSYYPHIGMQSHDSCWMIPSQPN